MTYYVILLVIISNNILLSLPITLTYYLIPNGSLTQCINLSSYYSFDSYLLISCLLELDFFHSNHLTESYN